MAQGTTVSHHFFRRTARKAKRRREEALFHSAKNLGVPPPRFEVEKARRGPFLWVVVRYPE